MTDLALMLGAVGLAVVGGEAFLKSILCAALRLRVPKMVVATTLAALATSSPELTVSSVAALAGQPEIGLGDALGSKVVNIALIFGLTLLYGAVQTRRQDFGRDYYLALAAPVLSFFFILDGYRGDVCRRYLRDRRGTGGHCRCGRGDLSDSRPA